MSNMLRNAAGVLCAVCLTVGSVSAGDITLLWNASADATSYRAYWGTQPGNYTSNQNAGNSLQTSISTLQDCTNYYFAVTASNAAGESGFSNEIQSWPRPVVSQATPSSGEQGQTLDVVITGTNYQNGAGVQFGGSGITVNSVTRNACGQITANITIAGGAAANNRSVTVTNPNGVAGSSGGIFSVVEPSAGVPDPPSGLQAQ